MAGPIFDESRFTIMDGALGTMLHGAGLAPGMLPERFMLEHPEELVKIHAAYVEAGAGVITANTFGANGKKLADSGIAVEDAVDCALQCAKKAADGKALVALDVGPLGEMLEPNGTLAFEEAYSLFAQVVQAGKAADVIIIETMTDLYEVKAAVLAAVENASLPVMVSMTFEEDGRTFAGVPVEAFAATVEGLGVSAVGINCSLGPAEIQPLLARLCAATALPVFAMPNAGLPDPVTGKHQLSPQDFVRDMQAYAAMGVSIVGGCCGTTPETIRLLAETFSKKAPGKREPAKIRRVCGATRVTCIDGPLAVGERINPTGKKKLREALQRGDLSYVQTLAVQQEQDGAAILDVNVGAPGVDEVALLPAAVKAVQAVSGLPLQLDSSNPKALEAGLRVCCGKPLVNSTSGEKEKLNVILPMCKRYGASVIGLTLDESGIPDDAEGRFAVAEKIYNAALQTGICKEDVYIDCLTLSVGAQPGSATQTLRASAMVKEKLGLALLAGASNISFGLPNRPLINRTYLALCLQAGIELAIINPSDEEMMGTLAAFRLLHDFDADASAYVARYGESKQETAAPQAEVQDLGSAIEKGLKAEAAAAAKVLMEQRPGESLAIVNEYMIPALDRVGKGFEEKSLFLPQLLAAAGAAQAAFEVFRSSMDGGEATEGPPVVVATVKGDVHDIGKNIAKVILENYGFTVIDLGRDVPAQAVVDAVKKSGARLAGLSALMTTTLPAMEETIAALHKEAPGCKILVGGAVLTEEYAKKIGADFFARDAKSSADYARKVHA